MRIEYGIEIMKCILTVWFYLCVSAGSYVALTLLGRPPGKPPPPSSSSGVSSPSGGPVIEGPLISPSSPLLEHAGGGSERITGPQPVDVSASDWPITHLVLAQYWADAGQHRPNIEPAPNAWWVRFVHYAAAPSVCVNPTFQQAVSIV